MNEAEQFFMRHAGWSYDPETETPEQGMIRGARQLAAAEARFKAGPYFANHEPDDQPWDGDEPYDGPLWIVSLYSVAGTSEPELIGSLGSVACEADDPYMRVVIAELASEHIKDDEPEQDDESAGEHAKTCPYPPGYCYGNCPVCGRHNAWGCGHER